MSVFFACCIGFSVNLDNFLIGMNLGLRGQSLSPTANLTYSLTSGLFALLPAALAKSLFLSYQAIAERVGAGLMIFYGLWCLKHACLTKNEAPEPASAKTIDLLLGIFLALNCVPPAISAGAFLLPPLAVGFFCFLFSMVSLWAGNQLGLRLTAHPYTNYLPHLSAILFVLIGYAQLWF